MENTENITLTIIDSTDSKPMTEKQREKALKQEEKELKRQQKMEAKEEQKRKTIEDKKQQKLNDADFMSKVKEEKAERSAEVIKRIDDEREQMLFKNAVLYNDFANMEKLTQNQLSKRILKYKSHHQNITKNILSEDGKRFRINAEIYIHRELKRLGIETKIASKEDYYSYRIKIGKKKEYQLNQEAKIDYAKERKDILAYLKTVNTNVKSANALYKSRKDALALTQKESRKTHALEKIQCPICNCIVSRTGLSAHKKTKKCIECKTQNVETTNHEP
jgi:hypothetical protein